MKDAQGRGALGGAPATEGTSGRGEWARGALLGGAYVALLVSTSGAVGYARDEGIYFQAAEAYAAWLDALAREPARALGREAIDAAFGVNHEHPPLFKLLFALSWRALGALGWPLGEGLSFRLPGMASAGLAVALLYRWGGRAGGRAAGLGAALAFALVPTTFFHAHLACFDVPIAALWLLTAYAYERSLASPSWPRAALAALAFGLALATKHNSWLLPPALGAHALASLALAPGREAARRRARALGLMALVGPIVLAALWPWLWHDAASRLAEYVGFHRRHDYYNIEFLGTTYFRPPFPRSYAWVMTAASLPLVTMVLAAIGLAAGARALVAAATTARARELASTALLWALGVVVNYAPWLSTETPIFGGTKHWLPAYPFLALFAGVGFARLGLALRASLPPRPFRRLAPAAAALPAFAAPAAETLRAPAWSLSAYAPQVGGTPGAASLGLNRTFWGHTSGAVLDALNALPPGAAVFAHDTGPGAWRMLQREGRLRADLRFVDAPAGADAALYHHEPHMAIVEYAIWVALGTSAPALVRGPDGVPTVLVYQRRR
ncbi:MAG TPA: glycosyltransferase family 39 protein [Polyangiaceae bacterium]|nr:glycosyltransferase family 39 protein [Polyangiaceae bacterium]